MRKKLLVRFFINKESAVPWNSWEIFDNQTSTDEATTDLSANNLEIADWMLRNPNGKVDMIWV